MKYLLIVFTIGFSFKSFSQSEKLIALDAVMSDLYHYHINNPTTKTFVNNITSEIERVFNLELNNHFKTIDSVLENISHHLPYFDSIIKANNINVAVDIYLSDLLLNSLASNTSYYARAKYKKDDLCRHEPFTLIRNEFRELIFESFIMNSCSAVVSIEKGDKLMSINNIPAKFLTNGVLKNLFYQTDTLYTIIENKNSVQFKMEIPTVVECINKDYFFELKPDGTGILKLIEFKPTTLFAIKKELERNKKDITKLIIDIRNFNGGMLNEISGFVDVFFEKKVKLFDLKFNNPEWNKEFRSAKKPIFYETKMFVLINNQTNSGANIIGNVFQHNKRATIIGEESSSDSYIQTLRKINGSEEFYIFFPTAFGYLPNHESPIRSTVPDVIIKDCPNDKDLILEYAVKN